MNYDVFISYSRRDKQFADALVHHLEAKGVKCWIDHRDLYGGSNWAQEIEIAIKSNPGLVLVLIFSGHVNESDQIIKEINLATSHKPPIPIIPVKIEDVDFSGGYAYHLGHINWMDAFSEDHLNNMAEFADKLQATVLRIKGKSGLTTPIPAEEHHPAPAKDTVDSIDDRQASSASPGGNQVVWPDVAIDFLKRLKSQLDPSAFPFKPSAMASDEEITENLEMDWSVDDNYYFAVWFDGKRKDKVDLLWGYYSEYEKRAPLFRKTAEALCRNEAWLNKEGDVLIDGNQYYFRSEDLLGFETCQRRSISDLMNPALVETIAKKMTAFSQTVWPIIVANRTA
ncbi:MAG: toll/interleukin-1 receptor domain-containing protein [Syntrophales bacterium]